LSISLAARLFGPLVPGRECGSCTACCFELSIDDPALVKAPRELCSHCTQGGCAIYEARPQDCRDWFCAWRRLADLPDDLNPERCGLLATLVENPQGENPFARLYIIVQWLDERPIARSAEADRLLAAMRRFGLPVWVGSGDRMSLHFPRQEVALHVMHGTRPPTEIEGEVQAWRRRLTM
jgi:hypothetical protein